MLKDFLNKNQVDKPFGFCEKFADVIFVSNPKYSYMKYFKKYKLNNDNKKRKKKNIFVASAYIYISQFILLHLLSIPWR
jgi:hypothetical protein